MSLMSFSLNIKTIVEYGFLISFGINMYDCILNPHLTVQSLLIMISNAIQNQILDFFFNNENPYAAVAHA